MNPTFDSSDLECVLLYTYVRVAKERVAIIIEEITVHLQEMV